MKISNIKAPNGVTIPNIVVEMEDGTKVSTPLTLEDLEELRRTGKEK